MNNVLTGGSFFLVAVFGVAVAGLVVTCFWRILKKAGYPGAMSLLILVPLLGQVAAFIIIIMLAFGRWPVYKKLSEGIMKNQNQ